MAVLLRYIWWSDQRLGAVSSTKPHFLFPLSQYFTNFLLFGPIKFDCCELPTFIFPSPPFSSIIQVPGIVSPYQDGSGWIGRLTGFLLTPQKGTLFNPSGALWTLFILEFRPASFCERILRPLHHYAIIFLHCQPLFLLMNDFAPIISACRYFTNYTTSYPKHRSTL